MNVFPRIDNDNFFLKTIVLILSFLLARSLFEERSQNLPVEETMRKQNHALARYRTILKHLQRKPCILLHLECVCVCVVKCVCWSESITTCSQSHAVASISNAYCYRCYRLECVLVCAGLCVSASVDSSYSEINVTSAIIVPQNQVLEPKNWKKHWNCVEIDSKIWKLQRSGTCFYFSVVYKRRILKE